MEYQQRLEALKDEIDVMRHEIDTAKSYAEDRRRLPDRRHTPRATDRRRAQSA